MQHEQKGDCLRLALMGAVTIYEAPALKADLLQALARAGELIVDLSAVEEIDTAGVQLLLLAQREAHRAGRKLRVTSPSPTCQEVLERYRLGELVATASPQDRPGSTAP